MKFIMKEMIEKHNLSNINIKKLMAVFSIFIMSMSLFIGVFPKPIENVHANSYLTSDDFNDGTLNPAWTLTGSSSINFDETGGGAKFTMGTGLSSWDYRRIVKPFNTPSQLKIDYSFDFSSVSYDGIGHMQVLIRSNNDQSSALSIRLRDYQASSTGYEPRIRAWDSSGNNIFDTSYGYQGAQSGSGQLTLDWIDSNTIRVILTHPGGTTIDETISGIRSDLSHIWLRGGFHESYSGSHSYVSFDNYQEEVPDNYEDDFSDGALDPAWTLTGDTSINFGETGSVGRFTMGTGLSGWDYRHIVRPLAVSSGSQIDVDFSFDFSSVSYDGIGHMQILIRSNNDQSSALSIRLRDYQASSTGYEPRIRAWDSSGNNIFDTSYGYQGAQSGSGSLSLIWTDSDSVRVVLSHPGGSTIDETIHGVRSDISHVWLRGGFHELYSGSHSDVSYDSIIVSSTSSEERTVDFSAHSWDVNENQLYSVDNDFHDYRDTVKFDKARDYTSQLIKTFSEFNDDPIEATVSFESETINADSHQFGASFIIDFTGGTYARITMEANNIGYGNGNGGLYGAGINPSDNVWYDLRIQLKNQPDMTGYVLAYAYKLSGATSWNQINSFNIDDSSLGTPTVIIGTHNVNGNSDTGGQDIYRFSSFDIRDFHDQDDDGLTDQEERTMDTRLTNPIHVDMTKADTDGDGLTDGQELSENPADTDIQYITVDTDGDTANTYTAGSKYLGLYASDPTEIDTDGDGWDDLRESQEGTNANDQDTDNDGLNDDEDSAPTVVDTFGPVFEDISGRSFTFTNYHSTNIIGCDDYYSHTVEVPDNGPIYFYWEKYDAGICTPEYVFMVADLTDESKLDYVDIEVNGDNFDSHSFTATENYGFREAYKISLIGAFGSFDFDIQYFDTRNNPTEVVEFTVEGSVSEIITDIVDFVNDGVNWLQNQIGEFIDWVDDTITDATEALVDWTNGIVEKSVNFIKSKIREYAGPLAESVKDIHLRLPSIIANFNPSSDSITDILNALIPSEARQILEDINNFISTYDNEIEILSTVIEGLSAMSNPISAASFFVGVLGDVADTSSEFGALSFANTGQDIVSGLIVDTLNDVLSTLIDPSEIIDFLPEVPSQAQMDTFMNSLESFDSSNALLGAASALFDAIYSGGGSSSLSLSASSQFPWAGVLALSAIVAGLFGALLSSTFRGLAITGVIFGIIGFALSFINPVLSIGISFIGILIDIGVLAASGHSNLAFAGIVLGILSMVAGIVQSFNKYT